MEYMELVGELTKAGVTLVAVSKTKPVEDILELYKSGHRIFGENRAQELAEKHAQLPEDIRWHMIGHLQRNKVKYIVPFVAMIESVDSLRLLRQINKEAGAEGRKIDILLQIKIAEEPSKYGFEGNELMELLDNGALNQFQNVRICGLMGMASFVEDEAQLRREFRELKNLFDGIKGTYFSQNPEFNVISMGMSGDYRIAISEGSTMVRIGSLLFGPRH